MLRVGSLFSGIGGIELGLHRTGGFHTQWFIEKDAYARSILARHFPGVPIYDDVSTVKFSTLPAIDMLTGGFPCQDASVANPKGQGIKGARTGLWRYFRDAIRDLRPSYVLIENVPNLRHRGLDHVLADLASLGYDAEWTSLRANALGAPHRRERLFLLAYPHGTIMERIHQKPPTAPLLLPATISQRMVGAWSDELPAPALVGVGHGIPHRVDRTRCLGNSVAPPVAELIGRQLLAARHEQSRRPIRRRTKSMKALQ